MNSIKKVLVDHYRNILNSHIKDIEVKKRNSISFGIEKDIDYNLYMKMKIGTLSLKTGLSTHTIRYYEKLGLINKPVKNEIGHRLYDDNDLDLINWVICLKKSGMSLEKIKSYVRADQLGNKKILIDILEIHLKKLNEQQIEVKHFIAVTNKKLKNIR